MDNFLFFFNFFFWNGLNLLDSMNLYSSYLGFFHDCNLLILLSLLTFIFCFLLSILFLLKFKTSFSEPESIEIFWTLAPCLILMCLGWPSLHLLYSAEALDFMDSITLKAIGHQWYWEYNYPNFNLQFDSFLILESDLVEGQFRLLEVDNCVVLPFSSACRILVISADVLHAWTIPSLNVKLDANPGRLNQSFIFSNFSGFYFGQCSELCGVNHSFMPIKVEFTSPSLFSNWVAIKSINN